MIAIALDDEPIALNIIENFSQRVEGISLVKTFTGINEAKKYLNKFPVDLIFLDINMPQMSGIDFCKSIPEYVNIVFTTAYSEFAVEGFELNAIDYLLKPFSFERFEQAVAKAKSMQSLKKVPIANQESHLQLRADYQLLSIAFDQIQLIESLADYIKIHLSEKKSITVRMTMIMILEKLPQSQFLRVHRSYIIPLSRINMIRNKVIFLNDGMEIQIGNSYELEVNSRFKALS